MASIEQSTDTSTPRELELLEKLNKLEADRVKFLSIVQGKIKHLEQSLEVCMIRKNTWIFSQNAEHNETFALQIIQFHSSTIVLFIQGKNKENERLIERNKELEDSLTEMLSIGGGGGKGKNAAKAQDDDVLLRAKELLFEKTKICKKLELQMEALNNQVVATKDALDITKSMLNLKNIENDHLQSRLEAMQSRVKCERDRTSLIEQKFNVARQKEAAMTQEFDLQRNIFKVCRIHMIFFCLSPESKLLTSNISINYRIYVARTRRKLTSWTKNCKRTKKSDKISVVSFFCNLNVLFELF